MSLPALRPDSVQHLNLCVQSRALGTSRHRLLHPGHCFHVPAPPRQPYSLHYRGQTFEEFQETVQINAWVSHLAKIRDNLCAVYHLLAAARCPHLPLPLHGH